MSNVEQGMLNDEVGTLYYIDILLFIKKRQKLPPKYTLWHLVTGVVTMRFHLPKICKWSGVP